MTHPTNPRVTSLRRKRAFIPLLLLLVGGTAACDKLLDVSAPSRVGFETLEHPGNAPLLVNSVRVAFECAFNSYIVASGLMGNELEDSQLAAAFWSYDRRSWTAAGGQYATGNCNGGNVNGHGIYQPLHTAVFMADTAVTMLEGHSDAEVANRTELIATASAYGGYAVLLLGEAMCESPLRGGSVLTSNQLFAEAETRLNRAVQTGSPNIRNFANAGLARARLNQGNSAGALSAAQAVPAGFRYDATFASTGTRESNRVERSNIFSRWVSVHPHFQDLSVNPNGTHGQGGELKDPRLLTVNTGAVAQDQTTILWTQQKFTDRVAPIAIARYAEMQLIIAEIEGGQAAVGIINQLHAAAGLPAWVPNNADDPVEILGHIIDERWRELYLESHHYFSQRRYHAAAASMGVSPAALNPNLPYFPAAGATFKHGGIYGDQPCLPLPDAERLNNPNI